MSSVVLFLFGIWIEVLAVLALFAAALTGKDSVGNAGILLALTGGFVCLLALGWKILQFAGFI